MSTVEISRETTHAGRLQHALPRSQPFCVRLPLHTTTSLVIPSVLFQNILSCHPRRDHHVRQRQLLSQEIRALHLRRVLALRLVQFLPFRLRLDFILGHQQPLPRWQHVLCHVVDPNAHPSALIWIGREPTGLIRRICVFEDLAQHDRLVQRFPLVLDRRYEPLGVQLCTFA